MSSASLKFGNLSAGDGNFIFQGIQNAPLTSALERSHFRHGNPPPLNRHFLGRDHEVSAIKASFREVEDGEQKRYVIYGMAGIGKSEICVKLLNDMRNEFWGIFWVDVSNLVSAEGDFKKIADQIRPGTTHETLGDALSALAEVDCNTHPWFLILDNADELREDYARFFPSVPGGSILLTSRNHECAVHETVGSWELGHISFEDSVSLLFKAARLRERDWESYRQQAETISKLLRSHTLALIQAGAYISRDRRNWNEYPKIFKENRQHLFTTQLNQARSKHGHIYATFEVSASALESDGTTEAKDALCLLGIIAMLHHSAFPTSIFEHALVGLNHVASCGYSDKIDQISTRLTDHLPGFLSEKPYSTSRCEAGLYCLEALSFIKQTSVGDHGGAKLVSIHPLAHFWAQDRLGKRRKEQAWMMTGSILALCAKSELQYLSTSDFAHRILRSRRIEYHIMSFLHNRAACRPPDTCAPAHLQVDYTIASILSKLNLLEAKEFLHEVFGMLAVEPLKAENPVLLPFYELMACELSRVEEYSSSMSLAKQMISLQEANSFPEEKLLVSNMFLLLIEIEAGATDEKIAKLESFLLRAKRIPSFDGRELRSGQEALGNVYLKNGEVSKAIEWLEQAVQIQQMVPMEISSDQIVIQETLSKAYLKNGQVDKAVELLEQVVQVRQKRNTKKASLRLKSERDLGCAYLQNGQIKEAMEFLEPIVQLRQSEYEEASWWRLGVENLLGRVYCEANRYQDALKLLDHVARVERATSSLDPVNYLFTLRHLAKIYYLNGQPEKAKEVVVEWDGALSGLSQDDARWFEDRDIVISWMRQLGMEDRPHSPNKSDLDPAFERASTDGVFEWAITDENSGWFTIFEE